MPDINIDELKSHIGTMVEDDDIATAAPLPGDDRLQPDRNDPAPEDRLFIGLAWLLFPAFVSSSDTWSGRTANRYRCTAEKCRCRGALRRRPFQFSCSDQSGDRLAVRQNMDLSLREGGTGVLVFTRSPTASTTTMGFVSLRSETASSVKPQTRRKSGIPKRDPVPKTCLGKKGDDARCRAVVPLLRRLPSNPHRIHYDRPMRWR